MPDLSSLGFGPFFATQLDRDAIAARIAAEHRGVYEVWAAAAEGPAQLPGRLRHRSSDEALPGVGDWVALDAPPGPDRTSLIQRVLERRTVFLRGTAGRQARAQVVAANVDVVFVVCGLDADFNPRRIERYLARVWASGAQPSIVLTKLDLCPDVFAHVRQVERLCPGVPVHAISAPVGQGLEPVRAQIGPGITAALVGSSGAGKSTLVNALLGEQLMATGAVRASDGRGCHVTTHRQLVLLPSGGLLLDTPGMRELQLPDTEGLDETFADITALAAGCRFRDCRHDDEPGCAVRAAVAAGDLPEERLEHLRKLEREARAFERRTDPVLHRKDARLWGQLIDEVARMRKLKEGE
jgi:ribosome biogenesis GTPase / thiamine phosphate phosphatase